MSFNGRTTPSYGDNSSSILLIGTINNAVQQDIIEEMANEGFELDSNWTKFLGGRLSAIINPMIREKFAAVLKK